MKAANTIKKFTEKVADMITDWQGIENGAMEYATEEIKKAKNPLTLAMLKALKLEAEKHFIIQQMIVDSMKKEAVHLSPGELEELSRHLNKYIEEEEKALCIAQEAVEGNGLVVPRYLLSYLIADLKVQNSLLRQLDDELKTASIPTSATSKQFDPCRAA